MDWQEIVPTMLMANLLDKFVSPKWMQVLVIRLNQCTQKKKTRLSPVFCKRPSFVANELCCRICKRSFRLENGRIFIVNIFSFVKNSVAVAINVLSFSFVVNAFYCLLRTLFSVVTKVFSFAYCVSICHLY